MSETASMQWTPSFTDRVKNIFGKIKWAIKERAVQVALKVIRWASKDSNYLKHARREFLAMGYTPPEKDQEDGPNKWIQENVLDLLCLFASQGHSGSSAPYCINVFSKMANFEPTVPLTGEDSEWNEVGTGCWQNTRCGHVFKEADGRAYDIQGIVFREPNGVCYTSGNSRVFIDFPYTPKVHYQDVEASE